jgi:fructose-specific phosphotransferase system IIC component
VLILPVVDNIPGYLIALAVGSLVTAFLVNFLKRLGRAAQPEVAGEAPAAS